MNGLFGCIFVVVAFFYHCILLPFDYPWQNPIKVNSCSYMLTICSIIIPLSYQCVPIAALLPVSSLCYNQELYLVPFHSLFPATQCRNADLLF